MPNAFVTGASRGIGAATAARLAREGYDVAIHYHQHAEGAEATAELVRAAGRRAHILQADLRDVAQAPVLAKEARQALGGVDALVCNAGAYDRTSAADTTPKQWRDQMAVNLDSPAALCQALHQDLAGGAIVHVSSIVAVRGSQHGTAYAAAKAGLLGLMRSQALEWAPTRVNAVCPGYVDTDILNDTPEKRRQREAQVPLGRVGTPDDIAGTIAWLVGPDAAYVTGQAIHVNGGLWIG